MIYEVEVDCLGDQYWRYNGNPHRDGDQPAVIQANGFKSYYKHGKRHRDGDKPAIIRPDGSVEYWKEGKLHREGDEPAVMNISGAVEYWKDGVKYFPKPADPCDGKEVEIAGKKYKLVAI